MRNMSFSMATSQAREKSKTVTRRLGWAGAKPGELLQQIGLMLLVPAAPAAAVTIAWDPNAAGDNVTGYLTGYIEVPGTTTVCPDPLSTFAIVVDQVVMRTC
jgi:hypothetical protein